MTKNIKNTEEGCYKVIFTDRLYNTCACGQTRQLELYADLTLNQEVYISHCPICQEIHIAATHNPPLEPQP